METDHRSWDLGSVLPFRMRTAVADLGAADLVTRIRFGDSAGILAIAPPPAHETRRHTQMQLQNLAPSHQPGMWDRRWASGEVKA